MLILTHITSSQAILRVWIFLSVSNKIFTFLLENLVLFYLLCCVLVHPFLLIYVVSSKSLHHLARRRTFIFPSTTIMYMLVYETERRKKCVSTTTLSKELQFRGISLAIVRSVCVHFDTLTVCKCTLDLFECSSDTHMQTVAKRMLIDKKN